MLASIHPLGERARNRRWGLTAAAHVLGSLAGGAALGGALGLIGGRLRWLIQPSPSTSLTVVAVAALVAAVFDLRPGGLHVPTIRRQVNEDWMHRYRGTVYGAGFGLQLGAGVVTIVTTASVYLAFALSLWSGSMLAGAMIGGTFGIVRGASILSVARVRSPDQLRRAHRSLAALDGSVRGVTIGVELLLGCAGLAALVIR